MSSALLRGASLSLRSAFSPAGLAKARRKLKLAAQRMTRARIRNLAALIATAIAVIIGLSAWPDSGLGQQPPAATHFPVPPPAGASFKLTFGLKRKAHGINWSGGLRNPAQVRSIHGWHFDAQDRILPPDRWDIALRTAGGEPPAKAVILDLLTPEEQPVTFFVREGDFQFIPAGVPYGVVHYIAGFDGDVSVERVPSAFTSVNPDQEDDDPALARTRSGELWMAWVAYRTRERSKYTIQGADEVFVARSQDGRRWSAPHSITPAGDHFRVALGEDRRGLLWCVYGLQKGQETGNFDLFGRYFDGNSWSGEHQLTKDSNPDTFYRMASDGQGSLYLVWMAYRGQPAQSDILMRVNDSGEWGEEINVSQSPEDDWEPSVGAIVGISRDDTVVERALGNKSGDSRRLSDGAHHGHAGSMGLDIDREVGGRRDDILLAGRLGDVGYSAGTSAAGIGSSRGCVRVMMSGSACPFTEDYRHNE